MTQTTFTATDTEVQVLTCIARDLHEYLQREEWPYHMPPRATATQQWRRSVRLARQGFVPIDWSRWGVDNSGTAGRKRNSRMLQRLEAEGLIERDSDSMRGQINVVRILPDGLRLLKDEGINL